MIVVLTCPVGPGMSTPAAQLPLSELGEFFKTTVWLSFSFQTTVGVRQGCILSSIPFKSPRS